jgi:hypothetical protein
MGEAGIRYTAPARSHEAGSCAGSTVWIAEVAVGQQEEADMAALIWRHDRPDSFRDWRDWITT